MNEGKVEFRGSPDNINEIISLGIEESFTLETYESLLDGAKMLGKILILARVITMDPIDNGNLFYFYYEANHINKVLFRKDAKGGKIHRMKSKNPLNNMPIVGDVQYYMINPNENHNLNTEYSSKYPTYHANYFANDDNFLEDENVRKVFYINSMEPKDCQIFELEKKKIQLANSSSSDGLSSYAADGDGDGDNEFHLLRNLLISPRHRRYNVFGLPIGYITPVGFVLFSIFVLIGVGLYTYHFYSEEIVTILIGSYAIFFILALLTFVSWKREDEIVVIV